MARTVDDVLARRTRMLTLNARAAVAAAPVVAALMRRELDHDETWEQQQISEFQTLARNYILDTMNRGLPHKNNI